MDFDSEEHYVSWEYVAKWQMPRIELNYSCVHVPMSYAKKVKYDMKTCQEGFMILGAWNR